MPGEIASLAQLAQLLPHNLSVVRTIHDDCIVENMRLSLLSTRRPRSYALDHV